MNSATKAGNNPHGLSQKELEIAAALWLSVRGSEPQIDWERFVENSCYKNVHSAIVSVGPVRKKLQAVITGNGSGSSTQGTKHKKKRAAPQEDAAGQGPPGTFKKTKTETGEDVGI